MLNGSDKLSSILSSASHACRIKLPASYDKKTDMNADLQAAAV